jgi:hypothetical protein
VDNNCKHDSGSTASDMLIEERINDLLLVLATPKRMLVNMSKFVGASGSYRKYFGIGRKYKSLVATSEEVTVLKDSAGFNSETRTVVLGCCNLASRSFIST